MAHRHVFSFLALLAMASLAGCDGDPPDGSGGSGGGAGADQGGGGQGGGGQGGGGQAGSGGTGGQGGATSEPPTEADALFQWLKDGGYTAWQAESGPHESTGPHGGKVRTFVNAALFESLAAGNTVHPKGAAAVKELYGSGSTITGWAAEVKTDDDSAGGQGWYWYENFSTTDPSNPVAAGNGKSLCFNCHSGGTDYVLTPFPLQ